MNEFGLGKTKQGITIKLSEQERRFLVSVLSTFYEEFPSKMTDKKCRDMIERLEGEPLQWA